MRHVFSIDGMEGGKAEGREQAWVAADPSATWVAEGAEIPVSDLTANELVVTPSKVAGLLGITSGVAENGSSEASPEVGAGVARDTARRIDSAFFGGVAANTRSVLASLTVGTSNVRDIAAGDRGTLPQALRSRGLLNHSIPFQGRDLDLVEPALGATAPIQVGASATAFC